MYGKLTLITCLILLFQTPLAHAIESGVVQGELIPVSEVRFEVIDGFAFQNYIKVYVKGLHVGNYMGPMGTKAREFKSKVDQLEKKAMVQGGSFYLPAKSRPVRGENVIEKIVHFPEAKRVNGQSSDLASCEAQLKELETRTSMIYQESLRVSRPLEQLIERMQSRNQHLGESEKMDELKQHDSKRSPSQIDF